MYNDIKQDTINSMMKIKMYLNEIDRMIPEPPRAPDEFQNSLKGLFFVYLYGLYESTVTKTVARTIECINNSGVNIKQCKLQLFSLILSPEYDSLYNVGKSQKWPKRWDISKKISENGLIHINEELMPTDGKNIQGKQLESLANSFGNLHPIFPRQETRGYLEEMVRFRNFIAHGDKLPQEVGRNYTIRDLEIRRLRIDELCTYLIDSYEIYIINNEYLEI